MAQASESNMLSLRAVVSRPMRRSTPELPFKTDPIQTASGDMKNDEYKVPFSRSFTGRTASGYSRNSSISNVDTRNVQVFLQRQGSRASLLSSASAGLLISDNVSTTWSTHSRPVSADNSNQSSVIATNTNTRLILPNPIQRVLPPSFLNPMTRSCSIPSLANKRRSSYLDKLVCRICDHLYMGGIEAAYNANLLCRLNIEFVIDISNMESQQVPRNKRSDCPCLCSLTTAHSRARMTIMIDEQSSIDMIPYFEDVNRFIDSARTCNKCVLVHSYDGRNRCALLVAQYLMKSTKLNLEQALETIKTARPDVRIGENFMRSLRKWEQILLDPNRDTDSKCDSPKITHDVHSLITSLNGTPLLKRSAWV